MRVIAISGKRGAGKDTLAEFLVQNSVRLFGCQAIRIGLADPIKLDIVERFGGDPNVLWGENRQKEALCPNTGVSYREMMRRLGAVYTDVEPGHFARIFLGEAKQHRIVICNDMRLQLEAEVLKAHGARLVRLTRAENPDDGHRTETELDGWFGFDAVIDNRWYTPQQTRDIMLVHLRNWGWLRRGL